MWKPIQVFEKDNPYLLVAHRQWKCWLIIWILISPHTSLRSHIHLHCLEICYCKNYCTSVHFSPVQHLDTLLPINNLISGESHFWFLNEISNLLYMKACLQNVLVFTFLWAWLWFSSIALTGRSSSTQSLGWQPIYPFCHPVRCRRLEHC